MIADSQLYTPRLTHGASIIYSRLRPNELVTFDELKRNMYIQNITVTDYIIKIRRVLNVRIDSVKKQGYILRES